MESVVATVSGYHGSERFNLIKLISYTGASFVGAMSRATTHLVCWKHEGRKYEFAKKYKIVIVNHQWIEDCIKRGKRVLEDPFILRSGQEVGPVLMEVPFSTKEGSSTKRHMVLSDKSNIFYDLETQNIGGLSGTCNVLRTSSCLLNKNLGPRRNGNTSHTAKLGLLKKTSKQDYGSTRSYNFQEPSVSRIRHEDSYTHSKSTARDKRKILNGNASTTAGSSHKGRRLMKKNNSIGTSKYVLLDSDTESSEDVRSLSSHSDSERNDNPESRGVPDYQFCGERRLENSLEDVDNQSISEHSNRGTENSPLSLTRSSQDEFSNVDTQKGVIEDELLEEDASLPTSTELSCIICWTDFSSTRGVLPCGHRFCYSCIKNWADHMASMRKISTCPLCKASFTSITKVEDAETYDQKIYSQTIPYGSSTVNIFVPTHRQTSARASQAVLCSSCRNKEPEDLLISCHLCQVRYIHSYCLDPPLLPWTCIHCKDLHMIYHHNR